MQIDKKRKIYADDEVYSMWYVDKDPSGEFARLVHDLITSLVRSNTPNDQFGAQVSSFIRKIEREIDTRKALPGQIE